MARVWLAAGMILVACNGGGDGSGIDTNDPPDPIGRGECTEESGPTFDVVASAADPARYETNEGIKCLPTVRIEALNIEDPDGDLTYIKMAVWFDGVLDGRVLRESPRLQVASTIAGDDCKVPSVPGMGMNIGIAGGGTTSPAFETETEFGVVLFDDADLESYEGELKVTSVVTPAAVTEADCD